MIGVGTRWSDFTTASKSAFQDPDVRFVNVNVAAVRRGQAQRTAAGGRCAGDPGAAGPRRWTATRSRPTGGRARGDGAQRAGARRWRGWSRPSPTRAACLRRRRSSAPSTTPPARPGVIVCAAGSAPGDLHKLWQRPRPSRQGLSRRVRLLVHGLRDPGGDRRQAGRPRPRRVRALVGDGSYLMLPGELVTAVAERIPITIVLVDNHGYASIGALSRSVGRLGLRHPLPVCRERLAAGRPVDRSRPPTSSRWISPPTPRAWARA